MADGQELAAQARRDAADLVESLSPEQCAGDTLCGDWTPHQVLGHMVSFVEIPLPKFMFNIARVRGDYDKAADRMARSLAERPVSELASILRAKAMKKPSMPMFPSELNLSDTAIHTQDIRRGLRIEGVLDDTTLRTTLDFLTQHKQAKNIFDTKRLEGLRLEATDLDWSHGSGETVSGPAEALMMGLTGRPVLGELEGATERLA